MENSKKSNKNPKETTKLLTAIRKLIKVKDYRQQSRQMLDTIDASQLAPVNKLEYLYIEGRYHYLMHKEHGDIEALEWSNDYLDDMASFAYEHKLRPQAPMLYTRAFVKYQLANLVWDEDRKPWLLEKAERITNTHLNFDPENSSFLWLKGQLENQ